MGDLINISSNEEVLNQDTKEIINQIIEKKDLKEVQDLTQLFNVNLVKKNILRRLKLEDLLDYVSDSMLERFEHNPDEMSNKDLIDFMNAINGAIDKNHKNIQMVDSVPQIAINNQQNNQVNITIQEENALSKESRSKILDFVQEYLKDLNNEESQGDKEENNE